ncbi:MAG TPA: patatin-like phospholipase family protein [Polyangia bacterium]|nr:patatin-like phospholipase family protein [Polyangia bacterium]
MAAGLALLGAPVAHAAPEGPLSPAPAAAPATPAPVAPAPRVEPAQERKPWALTVRGGVSLGAYEAGLTWAYLRLLRADADHDGDRDQRLRVITGASAGNINAFLAAINWCQSNAAAAAETATGNPFWSAWIPIGFEQLFPGPKGKYNPDDGLFTRRAFEGIEARIQTMLADPSRYDTRCLEKPLSLGVTVTRARPDTVCLGEDGHDTCSATGNSIPIKTQRFVLAFNVQVKPEPGSKPHLVFTLPPPLDRSVGSELRLLTGEGGIVSTGDLIAVMEASSAFPVAFGPRRIVYCQDDPTGKSAKAGCQASSDKFFDGGVFDNIPLGLAVNLGVREACQSEPEKDRKECLRSRPPAMNFLYLDPGHLRAHRESPDDDASDDDDDRRGLANLEDFLGNFVDVSTQYELQSVDRYVYQDSRMPLPRLTSHFHPIVGNYLGHFGAFLAKPFREYDYYVGLYDAVWGKASHRCTAEAREKKLDQLGLGACLIDEVVAAYGQLKLDQPGNEVASYMVKRLFTDELGAFVGDPAGTSTLLQHAIAGAGGQTAAGWLAAARALRVVTPAGGDEIALMEALVTTQLGMAAAQARAKALGPAIEKRLAPPATFSDFVQKLSDTLDARALPVAAFFSPAEQALLDDPDRWLRRQSAEALERLNDIEREDGYGLGKDLTVFGQLIVNSEPVRAPGFLELDPSSVPDTFTPLRLASHFLPYWIAGDINHGGYEIGWRPTFWPLSRLGISFPLTPFVWERDTTTVTGAGGAGLILRLQNAGVTDLEVVPARLAFAYTDGGHVLGSSNHTLGGEVAAYLAAGKLRLSGTLVDYGQWKHDAAWMIYVGIADVNGLIYWAIRLLNG